MCREECCWSRKERSIRRRPGVSSPCEIWMLEPRYKPFARRTLSQNRPIPYPSNETGGGAAIAGDHTFGLGLDASLESALPASFSAAALVPSGVPSTGSDMGGMY